MSQPWKLHSHFCHVLSVRNESLSKATLKGRGIRLYLLKGGVSKNCRLFFFWLHWVFVAALGLLFTVVCGLLIAVSCLIVDCGVWASHLSVFSYCGAQAVESPGSVVAVHGLCCSAACGIFPDQGSNPCPLHWRANS